MNKDEIKAELDKFKIEYDDDDNKDVLEALLDKHTTTEPEKDSKKDKPKEASKEELVQEIVDLKAKIEEMKILPETCPRCMRSDCCGSRRRR